ncbi:hypothetical protein [Novosphingobium cyanobacteriorum]|uniref:Transmembrane protein n=1 Tax=Novosphingobium cyanobacteriorum TaxID=3024215 RepID=A0ABT6CKG9_9SPHN|nr:hypothetical protein [Novosphingobium cyanobacteriorum]MDF8333570.1 hypothetical protein [Novosphingobium cyanobacteriorum]
MFLRQILHVIRQIIAGWNSTGAWYAAALLVLGGVAGRKLGLIFMPDGPPHRFDLLQPIVAAQICTGVFGFAALFTMARWSEPMRQLSHPRLAAAGLVWTTSRAVPIVLGIGLVVFAPQFMPTTPYVARTFDVAIAAPLLPLVVMAAANLRGDNFSGSFGSFGLPAPGNVWWSAAVIALCFGQVLGVTLATGISEKLGLALFDNAPALFLHSAAGEIMSFVTLSIAVAACREKEAAGPAKALVFD